MPTDDAIERDRDRATGFATQGTTAAPETEGTPATADDTPAGDDDADEREWGDIAAEDVIPDKYLDESGSEDEDATAGPGPGTVPGDGSGPEDDRDLSDMELEDLYDPEDTSDTAADSDGTATTDIPTGEDDAAEDLPGTPPLTEFDPGTGTAPISGLGNEAEDSEAAAASPDAVQEARDAYRGVLAGAAEDILAGDSPFEGWQFVAGRAADAAGDYVDVLDEALTAETGTGTGAVGATADETAALLGVRVYDPDDFTPVDLGLSRGSAFGRVVYAFQQEFSPGGGMETVFEGGEGGEAVIETLTTKLTNYTNWANGGHGDPVDAESLADLYRVAKDDRGLEKVADAAWNRGTSNGEVRSQAYVDKSDSMKKLATYTAQEVETGLAELDAHVATTDYSDSWVMADGADIETDIDAAVDAVKDGFKTILAAARIWNRQEQALSEDPETKQRYADAAAFFPDNDHAQQNRDAFHRLAEEGAAMMAAGRNVLESGLLDTIDAELRAWERVFEEQEVGALLDLSGREYSALEEAHDAYTDAKTAIEDAAGTLDSVLSYTAAPDEHDGAVDAIDAATAYLADLGEAVVGEMAPGRARGYGHAAVGEAMKDAHLPSYTPQEGDTRRDDLNTALRTFAGYVS